MLALVGLLAVLESHRRLLGSGGAAKVSTINHLQKEHQPWEIFILNKYVMDGLLCLQLNFIGPSLFFALLGIVLSLYFLPPLLLLDFFFAGASPPSASSAPPLVPLY